MASRIEKLKKLQAKEREQFQKKKHELEGEMKKLNLGAGGRAAPTSMVIDTKVEDNNEDTIGNDSETADLTPTRPSLRKKSSVSASPRPSPYASGREFSRDTFPSSSSSDSTQQVIIPSGPRISDWCYTGLTIYIWYNNTQVFMLSL